MILMRYVYQSLSKLSCLVLLNEVILLTRHSTCYISHGEICVKFLSGMSPLDFRKVTFGSEHDTCVALQVNNVTIGCFLQLQVNALFSKDLCFE